MGLFDQSPWELLTGSKSPVEKKTPLSLAPKNIPPGLMVVPGGAGISSLAKPPIIMAWEQLPTWGKVGAGVGAGLGLGWIGGFFDQGKKEAPQTQSFAPQQPITITKTISPVITNTYTENVTGDWSTNYNLISNSPYSSIGAKKGDVTGQASAQPSISPSWAITPSTSASQEGTQGQGTNMITLAAIAAVALVAYGFVSKPKKEKS